jgi:hypothetical protein
MSFPMALGSSATGDDSIWLSHTKVASKVSEMNVSGDGALAPVALFVYRRPDRTRRVLTSLLCNNLAKQSDLYIFSDAPKTVAAEADVTEVREIVRAVDGFRSVHLIERETNLGLSRSIIDGVTRLCDEFGRVIVIEDDLDLAPYCLEFMNRGLDRYAEAQQVMQIAGHLFPIGVHGEEDAFFLPLVTSWGWATWARAWKSFDPEATDYARLLREPDLRRRFDMDGSYPYFKMLEDQMRGDVDSWAVRWHLSVFMRDGLALYPRENLVVHEGWDDTATHATRQPVRLANNLAPAFKAERFPPVTVDPRNVEALVSYFRVAFGETHPLLQSRIYRKASAVLGKLARS